MVVGFIYGAYATEVFRGAFLAVPKGQIEAAKACGMSRWLCFQRIQLPQVWRFALPGLGNVWLVLLKGTAIISVVGLEELTRKADMMTRNAEGALHGLWSDDPDLPRLTVLSEIALKTARSVLPPESGGHEFFESCPLGAFDYPLIFGSLPALLRGLLMTIELVVISRRHRAVADDTPGAAAVSKQPVDLDAGLWLHLSLPRHAAADPALPHLYGLGQFDWIKRLPLDLFREAYWCCLTAFTLNTAAYSTEILRGAIQDVPHGEIEAARACGMSKWLLYRRIVLPRAFRIMLPAYSNEVISVLQASAISSVVTLMDLTGVARVIIARTFAPYEIFITIAVIYLALTYLIDFGFRTVEHRLSGHLRDRPSSAAKASLVPGLR